MDYLWVAGMALLVLCSGVCATAAADAATVFVRAVLPALFPAAAVGALWCCWRKPAASANKAPRTASFWFGLPRAALPSLWFGWLTGSPMGASLCGDLVGKGVLSRSQARRMLLATGTMSPMFFLVVLPGWLGWPAGSWLLAAHWLGAWSVGQFARACYRDINVSKGRRRRTNKVGQAAALPDTPPSPLPGSLTPSALPTPAVGQAFRDALQRASAAMLMVCGAMMLCAVLYAVLRAILTRIGVALPPIASGGFHALLEIGGGARSLADALRLIGVPSHLALAAVSGAAGFGGVSLLLQNAALSADILPLRHLLGWRLLQGALSFGWMLALSAAHGLPDTLPALPRATSAMSDAIGASGLLITGTSPLPPLGAMMLLLAICSAARRRVATP